MLLVIDNYDSFTYNLVQYCGELGAVPEVFRNDCITIDIITNLAPSHIIISPGPGRPKDAGLSEEIIQNFYRTIPILGVCLGHQAIGEVFGATITYAPTLMHGKTSEVFHDGKGLFKQISNPTTVTRYHSLVIDKTTLPQELVMTAWTQDQVVMGVRHNDYPLEGIQFHPESILTSEGKVILNAFLSS